MRTMRLKMIWRIFWMGFWCLLAKHYHSVASNLMRVGNAFCSHSTHELYWKYLFLLSHVKGRLWYSIALYIDCPLNFKSSVVVFEWYTAGYDAFYSPLNKLVFYATETLITCTFYIVSLVYIYIYIYICVCVCVINIYVNIHDCVSNAYIDETYDCVNNACIDETYMIT